MFNNSTSMVSSWTLIKWTRWKSSNCLHQSVHLGVRTDCLFQLVQLVFIITFYECALYFVSIISYVPTLGRSTNFTEKGTNWRPLKWFKTLLPIVQTHYIQLFLCIDFNKFWKKTCLFFLCYLYWSVGQRTMFPWTKMPLLLPWSHLHPPNDSSLETLKIQHGKKCFSDMLRPADIFDTLPADVQNLVSDACAQSKNIQIVLDWFSSHSWMFKTLK